MVVGRVRGWLGSDLGSETCRRAFQEQASQYISLSGYTRYQMYETVNTDTHADRRDSCLKTVSRLGLYRAADKGGEGGEGKGAALRELGLGASMSAFGDHKSTVVTLLITAPQEGKGGVWVDVWAGIQASWTCVRRADLTCP